MSNQLRIMTHNIWNMDNNAPEWEARGESCSAEARVGGLLRMYREKTPDIIGAQEASAAMSNLLMTGFQEDGSGYTLIWGRFTPIFYKSEKLELLDSEFLAYPEEIEGYPGTFNDVGSKSYCLAVFRVKESSKIFVFATTHLWWKKSPSDKLFSAGSAFQEYSDEAREFQLNLLISRANKYREKYSCPAIIVGDMNTDYNSLAIKNALSLGYRHAHNIATEYTDDSVGYHNCFPWGYEEKYFEGPFEDAIDHILVIGENEGAIKRFERYSPDYYFPISDHSPAFIDIEL